MNEWRARARDMPHVAALFDAQNRQPFYTATDENLAELHTLQRDLLNLVKRCLAPFRARQATVYAAWREHMAMPDYRKHLSYWIGRWFTCMLNHRPDLIDHSQCTEKGKAWERDWTKCQHTSDIVKFRTIFTKSDAHYFLAMLKPCLPVIAAQTNSVVQLHLHILPKKYIITTKQKDNSFALTFHERASYTGDMRDMDEGAFQQVIRELHDEPDDAVDPAKLQRHVFAVPTEWWDDEANDYKGHIHLIVFDMVTHPYVFTMSNTTGINDPYEGNEYDNMLNVTKLFATIIAPGATVIERVIDLGTPPAIVGGGPSYADIDKYMTCTFVTYKHLIYLQVFPALLPEVEELTAQQQEAQKHEEVFIYKVLPRQVVARWSEDMHASLRLLIGGMWWRMRECLLNAQPNEDMRESVRESTHAHQLTDNARTRECTVMLTDIAKTYTGYFWLVKVRFTHMLDIPEKNEEDKKEVHVPNWNQQVQVLDIQRKVFAMLDAEGHATMDFVDAPMSGAVVDFSGIEALWGPGVGPQAEGLIQRLLRHA